MSYFFEKTEEERRDIHKRLADAILEYADCRNTLSNYIDDLKRLQRKALETKKDMDDWHGAVRSYASDLLSSEAIPSMQRFTISSEIEKLNKEHEENIKEYTKYIVMLRNSLNNIQKYQDYIDKACDDYCKVAERVLENDGVEVTE